MFFDLIVYLQEEPVLCLRRLSQKHVKNRGSLSHFLNWRSYLQEGPVLCRQRLSLKQVKYRGPLSPFVFSWRVALFSADFLLSWHQKNASKIFSRGLKICRTSMLLVIVSQTRYQSLRGTVLVVAQNSGYIFNTI